MRLAWTSLPFVEVRCALLTALGLIDDGIGISIGGSHYDFGQGLYYFRRLLAPRQSHADAQLFGLIVAQPSQPYVLFVPLV
jgi:hypothetical protein